MVQQELTIANSQGIHLAVAIKVANLADKFDAQVHFRTEYMDINAKSLISLISATLRQGDQVLCVCEGADEEKALSAMADMLAQELEE